MDNYVEKYNKTYISGEVASEPEFYLYLQISVCPHYLGSDRQVVVRLVSFAEPAFFTAGRASWQSW